MKKLLTSDKIKTNIVEKIINDSKITQFQMMLHNDDISTSDSGDEFTVKCKKPDKFDIFKNMCNITININGSSISYKLSDTEISINNTCFSIEDVDDVKNMLCDLIEISYERKQYIDNIKNDIDEVNNEILKTNDKDSAINKISKSIDETVKCISSLKKKIKKKSIVQKKLESINDEISKIQIQLDDNNKTVNKKHKLAYNITTVKQKIADAREKLKDDPDNENLIALINKNNFLVRDYDQYMQNNKHVIEANNKNTELLKKISELENEKNNIESQLEQFSEIESQIIEKEESLVKLNEDHENLIDLDENKLTKKLDKLKLTLKKINKKQFIHDILDEVVTTSLTINTQQKNITLNFDYVY